MIKPYKVIDNFLEQEDFKKISSVLEGDDFPWFYQSNVTDDVSNLDCYYFTHLFYWKYEKTSPFYNLLLPVIEKIKPLAYMRIKGNLYPNVNKFIRHKIHTDFPMEHKGAIFYINSNNGKTIINNDIEIASVSNRILFFDPSTEHQSTNCTDAKCRININFNYF